MSTKPVNYITLKAMRTSGGLCSQLQIFAGLLSVAKANNMKVAFSKTMIENIGVGIRIFDLLNLEDEFEIKPAISRILQVMEVETYTTKGKKNQQYPKNPDEFKQELLYI